MWICVMQESIQSQLTSTSTTTMERGETHHLPSFPPPLPPPLPTTHVQVLHHPHPGPLGEVHRITLGLGNNVVMPTSQSRRGIRGTCGPLTWKYT